MIGKATVLVGFMLLVACVVTSTPEIMESADTVLEAVPEMPVKEISLDGPIGSRHAEISGMDWYTDTLILMPQYPKFDGQGNFYALPEADIEAYLAEEDAEPLTPMAVPVNDAELVPLINGFQGYEAIAFVGDRVYLTVEADTVDGMRGYLVTGLIAPDLSEIVLETAVITEILPQTDLYNMADEALLVYEDTLLTFYETNGKDVNENPVAHRFDAGLSMLDTVTMPHIEYRVTDATRLDENGRFWITNYYYPGDRALQPDDDISASLQGGWGNTHLAYDQVERLVELQINGDGIAFTETPPILLELLDDEARNWEGLVRFNNGFLLATDKFPKTILAFVER